MKVIGWIACMLLAIWLGTYLGCSRNQRIDAGRRIENAVCALQGEDIAGLPEIVARQRIKEIKRQNTEWTAENKALHPIEYCQAQLDVLARYADELDVLSHKIAVRRRSTSRSKADAEGTRIEMESFLKKAKMAYRDAEANKSWPIVFNGFTLSQEQAQERILDAAARVAPLKAIELQKSNLLALLTRKASRIIEEQKRLAVLRDRIRETITDLEAKKVVDGEKSIADALDAINDSIIALGQGVDEPSLKNLTQKSSSQTREEAFNTIMAQ